MIDVAQYLLISDGLSREQRAHVIAGVLELLAPQADTYESDLPLSGYQQWPAPVQLAADQLLRAGESRVDAAGSYAQTGVVHRADGDHAAWAAFTRFASYAFDATV